MARRSHYGAEKRQKEIRKQKKKEEKAEKRRLKREGAVTAESGEIDSEPEDDLQTDESGDVAGTAPAPPADSPRRASAE